MARRLGMGQGALMRTGRLAYRPELDGLRGIAVMLVVFTHIGLIDGGGRTGLHIFFVLSGYLITTILLRERGQISLRRFYTRRVRRLFPGLFAMTAAVLVVGTLAGHGTEVAPAAAASILYVANWAGDCSVLGAYCHTWSLATEEQFYLGWPLLLIVASRGRLWALGAGVVAVGLAWFLPSFWALGVGCVLAVILERTKALPHLGLLTGAAGFVLVFWSLTLPDNAGLWMVALATAVIVTDRSPVTRRVLSIGPLVELGRISYGVYLWHLPVILAFVAVAPEGTPLAVYVVAMPLLSIAAGWLSDRYVERRFRQATPSRPLSKSSDETKSPMNHTDASSVPLLTT